MLHVGAPTRAGCGQYSEVPDGGMSGEMVGVSIKSPRVGWAWPASGAGRHRWDELGAVCPGLGLWVPLASRLPWGSKFLAEYDPV
jgi:hypothetical protein